MGAYASLSILASSGKNIKKKIYNFLNLWIYYNLYDIYRLYKRHQKWGLHHAAKSVFFFLALKNCKRQTNTFWLCFIRFLSISVRSDFSGFVDKDKIKHFQDNRDSCVSKGKRRIGFLTAVKEMDEYLSNPKVWNLKFILPFHNFKIIFKWKLNCRNFDRMHWSNSMAKKCPSKRSVTWKFACT